MIDRIIYFSIRKKLVIATLVLTLTAWGIYSLTQLPIDAVPDITNNQVQIITVSPTLAAQETEEIISYPIEMAMKTIPDIVEIRSISRFGLSVVTVVFKDAVPVYLGRQLVREALTEALEHIPPGVGTPELAPVSTGLGEIYQYTLHIRKNTSNSYSAMELRTIQDWIVKRQLLGTPGVAEVSSLGGYLKQYEIAIDPGRLQSMNVSISDVFTALEQNNENTGGAYIEKDGRAFFIRGLGLIKTLDDIRHIVIKNTEGVPLLIGDVAEVSFGHAVRYGAMTRNGEGEVVGGIVMMLKGENSAKVVARVKERLGQIQKTLPEGVIIDPFLDRSSLVDRAVGTVERNLLEGGLIVVFVLVLLLGNLRAGLIVASVIPLSMLFTVSMMKILGISGNLMSLGAIDFGLIVDGAVIIVESIVHRLRVHGASLPGRADFKQIENIVYESSVKIRKSAAFGEIIILIVYLPILALVGIEGKMFRPMAQTVSLAILGAFLLSLTYVPMMSALCLRATMNQKQNISDTILIFFQRVYNPVIRFALRQKTIIVLSALLLFGSSLFLFFRMGGEFIPTLDEGDFAANVTLPQGASLAQTVATTSRLESILLKEFPEVKEVISKIGSSEIPTDPMPIESADMIIILKERSEWKSSSGREELMSKMEESLSSVPGLNFEFQQPIQLRFNELMTGIRSDIALKIYGEDMAVLEQTAQKASSLISSLSGIGDIRAERVSGLPQIIVEYNREQIARYGLAIDAVNKLLQTAFAGGRAGIVFEGEKRFDLVVRMNKESRTDIEDVRNLLLPLLHGGQIPLKEVADVEYREGPSQISREDARRRITIGINVRGRDIESLIREIQGILDSKLTLPPGYAITYGGQFENLREANERLSIAVPVALALIFVLLYFTFNSLKETVLIFTAVPMSAIGGVFALVSRGMPFSISAGVGFIALFGVAVLNGIVLISSFNQLEKEGVTNLTDRVLEGVRSRLRPVLMTAAVASLGFLPMAISTSAGAEVQRPLATVVIGGLISSTLLTLVVLPVLYILMKYTKDRSAGSHASSSGNSGRGFLMSIPISLLAFSAISAQQKPIVTIDEAIRIALERNGTLEIAQQRVRQQQALTGAAIDLPKTTLEWQKGQFNTSVYDYELRIEQSFAFPALYSAQTDLAEKKVNGAQREADIVRATLIRDVRAAYYQLWFYSARVQLLQEQDSLFAKTAQAILRKYQVGEVSSLENISAQARLREFRTELSTARTDEQIAQLQLRELLQTNEDILLPETFARYSASPPTDSASLASHPTIQFFREQIEISKAERSVQSGRLWPEFTLGYIQQSIDGLRGFQGFQVGISLPLWFKPYTATIEAAQIAEETSSLLMQQQMKSLQIETERVRRQVQKWDNALEFYEGSGLSQAESILQNAQKSYTSGEIGFVEYMQSLLQASTIRSRYLETLNEYNQARIALEYSDNR